MFAHHAEANRAERMRGRAASMCRRIGSRCSLIAKWWKGTCKGTFGGLNDTVTRILHWYRILPRLKPPIVVRPRQDRSRSVNFGCGRYQLKYGSHETRNGGVDCLIGSLDGKKNGEYIYVNLL